MRQEVARAHKGWALDQVTLHNEVTKWAKEEVRGPPPVSILPRPATKCWMLPRATTPDKLVT